MKKLLLWMCLFASMSVMAEPVLRLYNWRGSLADATIERFEQRCQCRVVQQFYSSNEEMMARLATDADDIDVVFPSSFAIPPLVRKKLLLPLDKSRLANIANLDPVVMNAAYDPGNIYSVPSVLSLTAVGYNIDKLRELKVDPYSWAVIFDPKVLARLKGHVTVLDSARPVFAAALLYLGRNPNTATDDDYRRARDVIAAARPYWTSFSSEHYWKELAAGDIWVSLGYSTEFYQAREEARRLHKPYTIGYVLQREGNELGIDSMAIPASAPHPELAHRFINFMLAGKNAADLTNLIGATNPVRTAQPYFRDDLKFHPVINPDVSALRKWIVLRELPPVRLHQIKRMWYQIRFGRAQPAALTSSAGRNDVRKTGSGQQ
jgi:spermidine/putrescine-binding protein